MDMIPKLIPEHARKQCAFIGLWSSFFPGVSAPCRRKAMSSVKQSYMDFRRNHMEAILFVFHRCWSRLVILVFVFLVCKNLFWEISGNMSQHLNGIAANLYSKWQLIVTNSLIQKLTAFPFPSRFHLRLPGGLFGRVESYVKLHGWF